MKTDDVSIKQTIDLSVWTYELTTDSRVIKLPHDELECSVCLRIDIKRPDCDIVMVERLAVLWQDSFANRASEDTIFTKHISYDVIWYGEIFFKIINVIHENSKYFKTK